MQMRNSTQLDIVAASKATSHALCHEPWLYELELDDEGRVRCPRLRGHESDRDTD